MFQNFQKVVNLISQNMEPDLVENFRSGIFDLPIFENALFIYYLLGYNFYEIEVKSMIQNFLKLDQESEDDILL